MDKKEVISETNLTFIMFGALNFQISTLDGVYKHNANKWFNQLFKTANSLWNILRTNMLLEKNGEIANKYYSDKSAFLCDCSRILINLPKEKEQEVLKYLQNQLK